MNITQAEQTMTAYIQEAALSPLAKTLADDQIVALRNAEMIIADKLAKLRQHLDYVAGALENGNHIIVTSQATAALEAAIVRRETVFTTIHAIVGADRRSRDGAL